MQKLLLDTLASSSAHGISRAAATQSIPLKVCWILLFFGFLGLFCNSATTVVNKLINVSIVTTSEINKVPFEFPDLYFCHTDFVSGSYPYTLNETEAATVNGEVERLSKLFDEMMRPGSKWRRWISPKMKADNVLFSMSPKAFRLLIQRPEQSLYLWRKDSGKLLSEDGTLCFKANLTNLRKFMRSSRSSIILPRFTIELFTDPYNPHFNYTGHPVRPIVDSFRNRTVDLEFWGESFDMDSLVHATGFNLVMVPQGAYPTVQDTSLRLAPGRSYEIALSMEKVVFDDELHGKNCSPNAPNLRFADFLSGDMAEYNSSYLGCLLERFVRSVHQANNFIMGSFTVPWDLRHSPRLSNLTEIFSHGELFLSNSTGADLLTLSGKQKHYSQATEICQRTQPCVSRTYKVVSNSFHKRSPFRSRLSDAFKASGSQEDRPALRQLAMIADRLDLGEHSGVNEIEFRNFLSDSMLRVRIIPERLTSTRLVISYSYSWTAFLADIGGLLGLYIGCSLLTVCELVELIIHLATACAVHIFGIRDTGCCKQQLTTCAATEQPDGDKP